jgi:hypothetical protein
MMMHDDTGLRQLLVQRHQVATDRLMMRLDQYAKVLFVSVGSGVGL